MTQRNSAKEKKRRKKPEKLEFVQDFIPIKDLRHGIIETTDLLTMDDDAIDDDTPANAPAAKSRSDRRSHLHGISANGHLQVL